MITIQRSPHHPFELCDESLLVKSEIVTENEDERVAAIEYRFPDSDCIVHRSVHVQKKKWPEGMQAVVQAIG